MKAWKKRTPAEGNDYTAFKVFWEQAIRIADKSIATPAIQYEYGMTITNDNKSTESRTSALENSISTFGSAYAATEERIRNQTDTINQLQGQLTNLQQMCHTIMTRPLVYPTQPTYTPRNNNFSYNTRGGRGGRGGGHNNNQQHFPTGPPATQVTPPNPVKRFPNMNYCHTHGGDVDDFHTSANCARPGPFHNFHATRNNTMGGSIRGMHKTIMPSLGTQQQQFQLPGQPNGYARGPSYPPMPMRPPPMPTYNPVPQMAPPTMPPPMAYQQQQAMAMTAPTPPVAMYQQPMGMTPTMPPPTPHTQFYGYNSY
jgi:hypothetical protein